MVNFGQDASRGKNASKVVVKTTRDAQFQLLHLSVLREYVWAEFTRDVPEQTVRRKTHAALNGKHMPL